MSIRELTCPVHGHPVGPDDRYCGTCGAALGNPADSFRRTWPRLVPASEPVPASITPIRPAVEFKPLDFTSDRPNPRRRFVRLTLAVIATLACVALLASSEVMLAERDNDTFWVATWLAAYAGTVIAVAGWLYLLIHRVRMGRRPARGDMASAH